MAAGIGALGFWLFIGAVCVIGPIMKHLKYKTDLEFIRSTTERGQQIDQAVLDKLMSAPATPIAKGMAPAKALRIAGIVVFFAGIGLGLLGYFLQDIDVKSWYALRGVCALVVSVSFGLFVASATVSSESGKDRVDSHT